MSVSTIIVRLSILLKKLADRDAKRAVADQAKYRRRAGERAKVIQAELARIRKRELELQAELGVARAEQTLGDNKYNERERAARTLSRQLGNIAG